MKVLNIISEKLQQILGENYAILPLANFNRNYTEAREYIEGDNVSYFRYYNSDYGKFRKDKIVGVISFINPTRSNVKGYYLSTSYKIDFSVPRNVVKTNKYNQEIEQPKFTFDDDIETLIDSAINQKLTLDDNLFCKLTMSDPVYISSENDGEFEYDIMQVTGTIVISDNAIFGSEYKVEIFVNGQYIEIDDINSFTEVMSNQNNAIVKHDKTKVEQNLSQLSWGCVIVIDDFMSDNLARKKLYDIIHLNKEVLNDNEESESLKRKLRIRITTPNNDVHVFNAIVTITFTTTKNGVGTYSVTFTDDNKPLATYTLSFNSNGGSEVESKQVLYYDKIGFLEEPLKTGYHYSGWKIDNELINANTPYKYAEDKVAVTDWVANKYYVEFDANGGAGEMQRQEFTYDEPQVLYKNTFEKENYAFVGWSTNKNDTQAMYVDMQEVLNLTTENNGVITLYAIWALGAPIPKISISGTGNNREIQINTIEGGYSIYYVLNQDKDNYPSTIYPMPTGEYYSIPISVSANETTYYNVQAVTRKDGKESGIAVLTFNIEVPDVPIIVANPRTGINVDNTVKDVTITSNADEIYYSVNSSSSGYPASITPSNLYTGQFTIQNTSNSTMYYTISAYAIKNSAISKIATINTSISTGTGSGNSGGSGNIGNV